MKTVLGLILLSLLTSCASKQENAMQDPSEAKAEARQREEFAKTLPKPPDH